MLLQITKMENGRHCSFRFCYLKFRHFLKLLSVFGGCVIVLLHLVLLYLAHVERSINWSWSERFPYMRHFVKILSSRMQDELLASLEHCCKPPPLQKYSEIHEAVFPPALGLYIFIAWCLKHRSNSTLFCLYDFFKAPVLMKQFCETLPFKTEHRIYLYIYIPSDRGCGNQMHQKFNLAPRRW
jgi:hypothetical protein